MLLSPKAMIDMNRILDVLDGILYVVTDLHGEWEPYQRYRDHFLDLYRGGSVHRLVFLGDVIHSYHSRRDASLDILLDIMHLQAELGADHVTMLPGNHELVHIYSIPLSKGDMLFTADFEHALGDNREQVITFLKSLPFALRTAGGVMLNHAGAHPDFIYPPVVEGISHFSHDALLGECDQLLQQAETVELLERYLNWSEAEYRQMAQYHLGVTGPQDPRYLHLLRGLVISEGFREFRPLWNFFFTQCEGEVGHREYATLIPDFLRAFSTDQIALRGLVTGHIVTDGSHEVIAQRQLRLSSFAHARPRSDGGYLLLDSRLAVSDARDLVNYVYPMP